MFVTSSQSHFCLSVLLSFVFTSAYSQTFSSHTITMLPRVFETTYFDEETYKAELRKRYLDKFSSQAMYEEFVEMNFENTKEYEQGNKVFTNLGKETKYLNEVLRKTIPPEYLSDNVKVRIINDPTVNAFSLEDGSINIHIGLLSVFDNEAQLAAVMSHEFGHYFGMHSYKGYKKYKNAQVLNAVFSYMGLYGIIGALVNTSLYYEKSRAMEKESDMYAIKFFKTNLYDPRSIPGFEAKLMEIQTIAKNKVGYEKGNRLFDTHPPTEKRFKYLSDSAKLISTVDKSNFVVDTFAYQALKMRAADEVMYSHFQNNDLDECIYSAYRMHLDHPKDEFYLYFLSEALRRKLDVDSTEGDEPFITQNFKMPRRAKGNSISIHNNLEKVYGLDKSEASQLANVSMTDSSVVEFVTNAEALKYFVEVVDTACHTCYAVKKRMGMAYKAPIDTVQMNELEKYIYDQEFFERNDTLIDGDYVPVFFNSSYYSKKGKSKYDAYHLDKDAWELEEFKTYYDYSTPHVKDQLDYLFYNKLNYREANTAQVQFDLISEKLICRKLDVRKGIRKGYIYDNMGASLRNGFNMSVTAPELCLAAKRHKFQKLIFVDLLFTTPDANTPGSLTKYQVKAVYYFVDLKKNYVIRRHGYNSVKFKARAHMGSFYPKMIEELMKFKKEMEARKD